MRNLTDHTVPILGRMSRQPVGIRGISVDMAAAERMQVAGYHFPFPATGFIAREGGSYAFAPAFWRPHT
jgi:hypothetical protein